MKKLTRLKTVRERRALSQGELGELAGLAKMTVHRIETGQHAPYPSTARKLARALGVEPHELFEEVG